jgi:hypothetical protein
LKIIRVLWHPRQAAGTIATLLCTAITEANAVELVLILVQLIERGRVQYTAIMGDPIPFRPVIEYPRCGGWGGGRNVHAGYGRVGGELRAGDISAGYGMAGGGLRTGCGCSA